MFSSGWSSLRIGFGVVLGLAIVGSWVVSAEPPVTETIVLIRHGEKPVEGLGQLNCQGLNRALALPFVIEKLFGKPDAVFAPDPAQSKPRESSERLPASNRSIACRSEAWWERTSLSKLR